MRIAFALLFSLATLPLGFTLADDKPEVTAEIELHEVAEDELVGRVVDADDNPIEGVEVDAWTWYRGNETRTDKKGRFRLKGLGRGRSVEVQFTKSEYSPRLFIRQRTGEGGWVVTMTNTPLFEGQVQGPDGKPVAGALIRANRGPKRADGVVITDIWTEVRTGPDGHYLLRVEEDKYDIQVRVPGVGVARLKETIAPNEAKELDIVLAAGIAFRAKVVDSLSGKPVEGVRIWNWQHGDVEGRSNAEGTLVVKDMFPGPFAFQIEATGFARWWSEQAANEWGRRAVQADKRGWQRNFDDLAFELEKEMDVATITVEQAAIVSGRVLDPDGKPVAGATVAPALTGTGNSLTGDTRFSVATDAEGRYTVQLPASGEREYNLIAHDGKFQQWRTWANGVSVLLTTEPGDKMDNLDIRLTRPATVRGRVVDRQGQPIAHHVVRASPVDKLENRYYDPETTTDADGRFELKFIRPGEQYIQAAQAPGGMQLLELTAGELHEGVELQAEPDARRRRR
jgi:protocatechuate 3,4-dioxygenase beta subunit